ncbi:ABC transporter substrate-binding protein [Leeuwenhoekiella marinoflava]|uniref:Peptide/nickel transport system substrate-binding protein n=2 Tax=Leeuwenhoekiella marinoflava TaxID=988 RepID=A0A4Q0PM46_9FLAO|nr:ABC transporter substrate-binding protein [Leeuwenhoekiella marinoflava]RXG30781.1 peptide/nickel transport system substrate-binding protein [Leeuwenhoekiella marinoflava]SHF16639.1 peptide/nickel transport system substrate-binding protein [Leeuwenhoekiella marinoflava DSM 3653]
MTLKKNRLITFSPIRFGYMLCAIFIVLLSSCNSEKETTNELKVFRYNEHYNVATLDPAFARNPPVIWPTNQLFNGLVQQDDSLNIVPDIAKSWVVSEDTKTYTFTLRDDVVFHKHPQFKTADSTRRVTAADFAYSFNRLKDPKVASPGSWVLSNVNSYKAVNDTTLIIKLKKEFPAFMGLLTMRYCSVVPKEIVEFYGNEFRKHPIGTGPFKFKRWEEGVKLVLRKNQNYFETDENGVQLPYLEAVAITFLPDKQSEFLQFAQGNLDMLNSLDPSYKDELLTATGKLKEKYEAQVKTITGPFLNTEYLGFFLDSPSQEVRSALLRKAVNYGFDRVKMIKYLRNGIGEPAQSGFIPKGLPGYGTSGFEYNPAKARKLIDQYIEETGISNPSITIGTNSQYLDICEYIQREIGKQGLTINIDVMPPSTLRQLKSTGKLDAFRASWIADYPDAENYLSLYYSKNFTPKGPNYTHFSNEEFDRLYEASFKISDVEKRKELYQKMDSILISKAPFVTLYYDQVIKFVHQNVTGLKANPQDFLILKHVKKE